MAYMQDKNSNKGCGSMEVYVMVTDLDTHQDDNGGGGDTG